MKKALVILLSVFYLLVTIGLSVHVHYCSGKIASVQLFSETSSCCGEERSCNSDCCHQQSEVIQFEEQQTLVSHFRLDVDQPSVQFVISAWAGSAYFSSELDAPPVDANSFSPPNEPVWLLHCSLVYYG